MEEFIDSATKTAYDGIRHMIFVTHELKPGQKLVESTIAKRLNISRTPVREAIHSLVQDGVVERIQNRGTYVCVPTREDIVHYHEISAALASMICYLVAERVKKGEDLSENIRDLYDAVDAMDTLVRQMDSAINSGVLESYLMLDRDFHRYLSNLCGNEHLRENWQHSHERCFHEIWNVPRSVFDPKVTGAEHRLLVEAIERGDVVHAQQIAMMHFLRTRTHIKESPELA